LRWIASSEEGYGAGADFWLNGGWQMGSYLRKCHKKSHPSELTRVAFLTLAT
jgi:hypothetical protein